MIRQTTFQRKAEHEIVKRIATLARDHWGRKRPASKEQLASNVIHFTAGQFARRFPGSLYAVTLCYPRLFFQVGERHHNPMQRRDRSRVQLKPLDLLV
jgi:hypothetical protein